MVRFPTWAGILILALALSFGSASAFTAPTVSPGVGGGSLQLDASGNLGIGTSSSTPVSTFNATSTESGSTAHGKVFMVASSTNPGIGLKNLSSGNTYLWSARNFGNLQLYRESNVYPGFVILDINQFGDVAIGTSTASTGSPSRLTVNGTTTINGNVVANAVNATLTGNVAAGSVTTGIFSSGNFAFQNALGVGTTSLVGLPTNGLLVTGTTTLATTAGNVGVGTVTPDQKLQVAGNIRLPVTGGKIAFGTAGSTPTDYLMLQDITSPSPSLEFVQDGSVKFMIQGQTGNVGIGTSIPTTTLTVAGDITALGADILFGDFGNSNREFITSHDGGMAGINTNGVFGFYADATLGASTSSPSAGISVSGIYSNGKVGINTTVPSSPLHVVGSTTITDDIYLSDSKSIRLDSGSNTTLLIANYNSGGFAYGTGQTASLAVEGDVKGNRLCFGDADCKSSWSEIVTGGGGGYWLQSGSYLYPSSTSWSVGIGTATPTSKLHVSGSGAGDGTWTDGILIQNSNATAGEAALAFNNISTGSNYWLTGLNQNDDYSIAYGTGFTDPNTKFRITAESKVGIGVLVPVAKLDVSQDNGEFSLILGADVNASTRTDATRKFARIGMPHYTNSEEPVTILTADSDGTNNYLNFGGATTSGNSPTAIRFFTAANNTTLTGTERMRLSATGGLSIGNSYITTDPGAGSVIVSGNVGIGTTTPATQLHVVTSSGNAATFSSPITVGYPVASTDAARKDYVDAVAGIAQSASWVQSGSYLYPSSTSWSVAIGTTTPYGKLHLVGIGYSDQNTGADTATNPTTTTAGGFVLDGSYSNGQYRTRLVKIDRGGNLPLYVQDSYGTANSFNNVARFGSHSYSNNKFEVFGNTAISGNLGLGTTSASSLLHLSSNAPVARFQDNTHASSSNSVDGYILFADSANSQYGYIGDGSTGTNNIDIYGGTTHGVSLFGGGVRGLNVNTSGNVGVGTTTFTGKFSASTEGAWNLGDTYPFQFVNLDGAGNEGDGLLVRAGSLSVNSNIFTVQDYNGVNKLNITGDGIATFSSPLTIAYPVASTDAARKDYVDAVAGIAQSASWVQSGSYLYPSSTSWSVAIGTTTPEAKLHIVDPSSPFLLVENSAAGGEWMRLSAGTSGSSLKYSNTGVFSIGPVSSKSDSSLVNSFVLDSSGNVGIGTTTPSNKLTVSDGTSGVTPLQRIENYSSGDASLTFAITGIQAYTLGIDNSDSDKFKIGGNSADVGLTNFITVDSSGNVGIGTTTPATELHVISASGNAATFNQPITIGYPVASTDAARKDYVDTVAGVAQSAFWTQSGSNLYPSSTSWRLGVGLTNPAAPLNVYATSSLATSTETVRLTAPQNYTAGFGPKLSFWNGTSEQLALITGSVQNTGNGNFGRLDFGTRTSDALGVQTKVSILANGNVGIGTTTPAHTLSVLGGNITIQPGQLIAAGLGYDSVTSAASSSIELYNGATGDLTIRTGYSNGDILLMPRANVGIGTTTPATELHVVTGSGNAATFSSAITIGYPVASTDAARKDYVDSAVNNGNATSSKACNGDATCEITNADFGGTGNITGVNKLTVTTIDPLYEIKGKKYSTYASAIAGGVKEEYVGRGEMKKVASGKWQMALDFDSIKDGSDLWVWKHTVDFSPENVEILATPIGVPVPVAYEIKGNKIVFFSESSSFKISAISFSYRLIGKRVDWAEWPTFAKDQSEKANFIIK